MSLMPPVDLPEPARHGSALRRLRTYLLTGLLALAPSAITLWVLYKMLNWTDNLLGRYLRFQGMHYQRIPGLGLVATFVLLLLVGWLAAVFGRWLGGRPLLDFWDHLLSRIPGVGLLYGSTKSFGEAFFTSRESTFKQVVLVPWPSPGIYRLGFVAARPGADVRRHLGEDIEVVFVPHTPNPASGFVHYVPRSQVIHLDWSVEEALKVIVSGGVLQPNGRVRPAAAGRTAPPSSADAGTPAPAPPPASAATPSPESSGGPRP
jgi:uncharacterized membrane protein